MNHLVHYLVQIQLGLLEQQIQQLLMLLVRLEQLMLLEKLEHPMLLVKLEHPML
jgi:hypothetical protein